MVEDRIFQGEAVDMTQQTVSHLQHNPITHPSHQHSRQVLGWKQQKGPRTRERARERAKERREREREAVAFQCQGKIQTADI